jgi:hypothetical protein
MWGNIRMHKQDAMLENAKFISSPSNSSFYYWAALKSWGVAVALALTVLWSTSDFALSYTSSGKVTVHFSVKSTSDWDGYGKYSHAESTVDASFDFPAQNDAGRNEFSSKPASANFRAEGNRKDSNGCIKPSYVQTWNTSGKLDAKASELEFDTYWHHGHGNDDVGGPFDYFSPVILSTKIYFAVGSPSQDVTSKQTFFDCNGTSTTQTSNKLAIDFNGAAFTHRLGFLLSRSELPEKPNFTLVGSRSFTEQEIAEIQESLSFRGEVLASGHLEWNISVSDFPLPVPKFSAVKLTRGEVLDLSFKPFPSESDDPNPQWNIEPQPDCYRPIGFNVFDSDVAKALTNPEVYESQDNQGQPTIRKGIKPPLLGGGSYGSLKWNMLCTVSIVLEYYYGTGTRLLLRSKPQIVEIVPRPWAIDVINKFARTDPQKPTDPQKNDVIHPLEPSGAAPMLGINVRPDCIRNGRISSPVEGDSITETYCGVVLDGFWTREGRRKTPQGDEKIPPPPVSNFVQSAFMPWNENYRPLPQTTVGGYLATPTANESHAAGYPESPFQLIYWNVGHRLSQTNIAVMNPSWRKGGEWYNANQGATNLSVSKVVECTLAHEALHGRFMAEALRERPASAAEVQIRETIVDPAYLIEGMWDVEEEKLLERIAVVLGAVNSAIGSTLSGEENSAQHKFILHNMPNRCRGTVDIVLPIFGKQRWDLSKGEIAH